MNLTSEIIKLLEQVSIQSGIIHAGGEAFIRIEDDGIFLKDQNLLGKIVSPAFETRLLDWQTFFGDISESITSLDHLGIRYSCPDISKELEFYKNAIKNSNLEIVEEPNPEVYPRWFFIRHKDDLKAPMFEIVLYESLQEVVDEWTPHFQIDLNTSLSIEELREKTNALFEPGFIRWQLDIPGVGVVLTMGIIGRMGNTKLCVGLGTDRRNVEVRNKTLRRI